MNPPRVVRQSKKTTCWAAALSSLLTTVRPDIIGVPAWSDYSESKIIEYVRSQEGDTGQTYLSDQDSWIAPIRSMPALFGINTATREWLNPAVNDDVVANLLKYLESCLSQGSYVYLVFTDEAMWGQDSQGRNLAHNRVIYKVKGSTVYAMDPDSTKWYHGLMTFTLQSIGTCNTFDY
jgi:hypothetical protein